MKIQRQRDRKPGEPWRKKKSQVHQKVCGFRRGRHGYQHIPDYHVSGIPMSYYAL